MYVLSKEIRYKLVYCALSQLFASDTIFLAYECTMESFSGLSITAVVKSQLFTQKFENFDTLKNSDTLTFSGT